MKELFNSYRLIYIIVFFLIVLGIFVLYYFQIQNGKNIRVLNSISIISSALTILGVIITIVEIYGINAISKLTKAAATEAINDVKKNNRIIQIERLKYRIEILKVNLFNNEIGITRTHLIELINTLKEIIPQSELQNLESDQNIIMDNLEKWKTILEVKLNTKKKLNSNDMKRFIETLAKTNSLISK